MSRPLIYPEDPSDAFLDEASRHLASDEVLIRIDAGAFTVYGCDLTEGYGRIIMTHGSNTLTTRTAA
jgi:glutamate N-acetyltransferase / amino-acid N-acetyltransferase